MSESAVVSFTTHSAYRDSTGLRRRYQKNSDFLLHVRQLAPVAFLSRSQVVEVYVHLLDNNFSIENELVLLPLINYFEDTRLGRLDSRRQHLFPTNLWVCYDIIEEDIPRTNNAVGEWYNSFFSATFHSLIFRTSLIC